MNPVKKTVKFYDSHVDEFKKNTESLADNDFLNLFISLLPMNASVLDAGCGFGRDAKLMLDKRLDVHGIDLSEKMIEEAKKYCNAHFSVMDMRHLNFEDDSFDGVWCSAALLHLPKKEAPGAIEEFVRVLRPRGLLYLSLKEGKDEGIRLDDRYKDEKYYAYYTREEITSLLKHFVILKLNVKKAAGYADRPMIRVIARNI